MSVSVGVTLDQRFKSQLKFDNQQVKFDQIKDNYYPYDKLNYVEKHKKFEIQNVIKYIFIRKISITKRKLYLFDQTCDF